VGTGIVPQRRTRNELEDYVEEPRERDSSGGSRRAARGSDGLGVADHAGARNHDAAVDLDRVLGHLGDASTDVLDLPIHTDEDQDALDVIHEGDHVSQRAGLVDVAEARDGRRLVAQVLAEGTADQPRKADADQLISHTEPVLELNMGPSHANENSAQRPPCDRLERDLALVPEGGGEIVGGDGHWLLRGWVANGQLRNEVFLD